MTVQTLQPQHSSTKAAALGIVGVGLAVGAAFGVAALVSDDGVATAPGQDLKRVINTEGSENWDSWRDRILPEAQTRPGLPEEKLRQLR